MLTMRKSRFRALCNDVCDAEKNINVEHSESTLKLFFSFLQIRFLKTRQVCAPKFPDSLLWCSTQGSLY